MGGSDRDLLNILDSKDFGTSCMFLDRSASNMKRSSVQT